MRGCILAACGVAMVFAGLATNRLGAEETRKPSDQTQRYLEKYAQFLTLIQEAQFQFVGTRSRSTPKEGLAGRWEESGTLATSAAEQSYHLRSVVSRVHPDHEDLGGTEDLATPKRYLEVSTPSKERAAKGNGGYHASTLPEIRGDGWKQLATDHSLGVLLGFAQLGDQERPVLANKSLLEICEAAELEWLPEVQVDSKHLVGFVAKNDALEVRVLFDPAKGDNLTELRVALRSDKGPPKAGTMTSVSFSILDLEFTDGKPASIKVKVVWQLAGGLLDLTRSGKVVAKPTQAEFEPQTWEFNYQLAQFNYAPEAAWFTLETAIPNGTPVKVRGLPSLSVVTTRGTIGGTPYTSSRSADLELYWKDGRLTPIPLR
jgi:hypothetical protein